MSKKNAAEMKSQFDKTHTGSREAKRKAKKAVIQPQRFDYVSYGDVLWVGDPANELLGCDERVRGYVIVAHTTRTRIYAKALDASDETKEQTWYRDGRQMGGDGNCLLRPATIGEIVKWELARAEERRVCEAEEKQKDEEKALRSVVPEGIGALNNYGDKYILTRLSREQVEVASEALKTIVR
jgi:hypothetical protein